MSLNLADLRKNRTSNLSAISQALTKTSYDNDKEGFWSLERDKAGNGQAIIRFLPKTETDELAWVKVYNHGFKGPSGKWMIDNCPTTLGDVCPVCESNTKLWSGSDADKKLAGERKRKLRFISNILVVSDPKHPENDGKVFLFSYGKSIFDKIAEKAQPTFQDESPVDVFDIDEGCNFKLRIKQKDGYPSYENSQFAEPSPLANSDEKILSYLNQMKPLGAFLDKSKFKSYDVLSKKLKSVLSGSDTGVTAEEVVAQMRNEPVSNNVEQNAPKPIVSNSVDVPGEDDDMEAYFAKLAE